MGVRGLTTYVKKKADRYFENYKLRNCLLLVDGYCLAAVLYNSMIKSNTVFGGDYDRYSKEVETFVKSLVKCGIRPLFVFDGGYERKKLETVRKRNEAKMYSFEKVGPTSGPGGGHSNYPLMMRQVLRDRLVQMGIEFVQSDFEADREIAALGRLLACPVLSNDSDFLIYDVLYVPVSTFNFRPERDPKTGEFYIDCEVYRVEKFLEDFGGLSKSVLPLLATLLGNDYISRSAFKDFYSHIRLPKGKKTTLLHRRIVAVLEWLQKETFDTAIHKILSRLKKERRRLLAKKMKDIVKVYTDMETPLLAYLPSDLAGRFTNGGPGTNVLEKELEKGIEDCEEVETESSDDDDYESSESGCKGSPDEEEDDAVEEVVEEREPKVSGGIPEWLLDESRRGRIHSCVITLVSLRTYFFVPQVEDGEEPQAGNVAVPVLAHLCGLLLGSGGGISRVTCWGRRNNRYSKSGLEPIAQTENYGSFPPLSSLNTLSPGDRLSIFTGIVGVEEDVLGRFPSHWRIFVCSFLYWLKNSVVLPYQAHALLVMSIAVNVFDEKIGYYRNKRPFMQRYGSKLKQLLKIKSGRKEVLEPDTNIEEALAKVSADDCLVTFDNLLPYFHMDENLLYKPKFFSRTLVHRYAEFQSCLDTINTLNSVLLRPYCHCDVGDFYNGTFLYNFATNLKKRTNISSYVGTFFAAAPAIVGLYNSIVVSLREFLPENPVLKIKSKKKKKKKTKEPPPSESDNVKGQRELNESSDSNFVDANNPYSLLQN